MRIVCPACAAIYQVPDSLLGSEPRPLRCARCGNEWIPGDAPVPEPLPHPETAADEEAPTLAAVLAEATAEPEPATQPTRREVDAAFAESGVPTAPPPPGHGRLAMASSLTERWPPRTGRSVAQFGWAASILLLIAILGAGYLLRTQVQAAWPPSQRAYGVLGLH